MLPSHVGYGRACANDEYRREKGYCEAIEVLEDVPLDENNLEKFIRIGASMEKKTKQNLVQFLKKSIDVFAWS